VEDLRRLGRGLGSRTLRFGDRGPDVRELHAFLRQQGYDLGEESHFGYLTKDAVRQFQRDHGLVADGIAGRRFFALAQKGDLPIRRRVHVVQPGETLGEIADQYGVGPEAFGSFAGRGIYTGQRLVFFDREVWAICRGGEAPDQPGAVLTGVIGSDPSLAPAGLPCMLRPEELEWDVVRLHSALKTPRRRRRTAVLLSEAFRPFSGACGLYLPWREVAQLDGVRYVKLLRRLRKLLGPGAILWVELGPSVPAWRLWGGVDYAQVNELADRVVLRLPRATEPGPLLALAPLKEHLNLLLRGVHSWKVLLDVPVYSVEWECGPDGMNQTELSYQAARSKALRRGARLRQGEHGELYYSYHSRGLRHEIHLPPHTALAYLCTLVNRRNLAGVVLDWLGMEDPRIWETLRAHFRTAILNNSRL